MQTALAQQHLYIGFMGLGIEVIDKENRQIYFVSHYLSRNLGISPHGAGLHTFYISLDAGLFEHIPDQTAGGTCAYKVMPGEIGCIEFSPVYHIGFPVIVCHKGDIESFLHAFLFWRVCKITLFRLKEGFTAVVLRRE